MQLRQFRMRLQGDGARVGAKVVSISRMTNKFILNAISSIISGFLPSWFTMLNSTGIDYLFYLGIAFATGATAVAGFKIIGSSRFKKVFLLENSKEDR